MRYPLVPLFFVLACRTGPAEHSDHHTDADDTDEVGSDTETETSTETETESETGSETSLPVALQDWPCFSGNQCAAEGPFLGDTCCAVGEPLLPVGTARGDEVVDLEVIDDWIIACGGFGARISRRADSGLAEWVGGASERCQRATFGPEIDGGRMVYVSHHGDSWVREPRITTTRIMPDGDTVMIDEIRGKSVLYEGMRVADGWLYVAAHKSGLRIFELDERGAPKERSFLDGFDNAVKVEIDGKWMYVIDGSTLHVLHLDAPGKPRRVTTAKLVASARDLAVHDGLVVVALGGWGVQRIDVRDPNKPVVERSLRTVGSVQAVDLAAGRLAVAAWTHVELRDPETLLLLGTRNTRPNREYEQDLGVSLHGDRLYVGEWEGVHTLQHQLGVVQPDVHVAHDVINVYGEEPSSITLRLFNRGPLPLSIDMVSSESNFVPVPASLTIPPGTEGEAKLEVMPPLPTGRPAGVLDITTNDPDTPRVELPIYGAEGGGLQVGDTVDESFAFLDPTGDNDVENLRGKVTVLAYFALF